MLKRYHLAFLFVVAAVCTAFAANDLTADEVITRHLNSVGAADALHGEKSRVVEGTAAYKILVGGSGESQGKAVVVSESTKMQMMLKIDAQSYHGERFISTGKKSSVAGTYDDHTRSELGEFLRSEDAPLRDGLLGGVLTTAWPLLDKDNWNGRVKYQGIKKIDGRDLYALAYKPKKNADLEIMLYFEPETFHHVLTVYRASLHAGIGAAVAEAPVVDAPKSVGDLGSGSDVGSARQQQTRYRIEERFSDFKANDGLTLPSHYELRFTEELQSGFTKSVVWNVDTTRVLNNVTIDARNFDIH
jgi:hypothetical protein